ncbi:MAG: NlpC/P60 family protein [Actinomycetes bacterium]
MSHRGLARRLATGLVAVAASAALLQGAPAFGSPGIVARMDPVDPATLSTAQGQAEQLRARLARISGEQDRAQERLAYVRDQLASASNRAISTEQQLAALATQSASVDDSATNRVRALYMSGGAPALYSSLLDGGDISDVLSRATTVQQVLQADGTAVDTSTAAFDAARTLRARQAVVAQQRAQLAGQAAALVKQLDSLKAAARQALHDADSRVEQLAAQLAQQRQAAAEAAAAQALAAYGLTASTARPASGTPFGDAAVTAALTKLGSPYVWGDEGPDTFDCSGLVQWAYAQAGLSLPRLASDQYFASRPVDVSQMLPGDVLVYAFDPRDAATIHHITMYIGNGQMVEAPHTGAFVRVVPVYFDGLYGVARPGLAP